MQPFRDVSRFGFAVFKAILNQFVSGGPNVSLSNYQFFLIYSSNTLSHESLARMYQLASDSAERVGKTNEMIEFRHLAIEANNAAIQKP